MSEMARREIPRTEALIREILRFLESGDTTPAYGMVFDLTSRLYEETGVRCIVILDEFHRLGDFAVKNAFQNFGKRIMFQKDTMYVISSSSLTASRRILAEKLALLFGNFERINLKPFSFEASSQFIERRLEPVRIEGGLKKFLIAITDGHPFFLNVITKELTDIARSRGLGSVTREALVEALRRLLFDADGVLNQYFMSWIAPWTQVASRGSHLLLLVGLANAKNKLKDLADQIQRSPVETSRQLKELMADELIMKNGSFYYFHNEMFRFWLKHVYQAKEMSLLVHMHAKLEEFLRGCNREVEDFLRETGTGLRDRLINLVGAFQNDSVEFDSKGRRLPHFSEIEAIDGPEPSNAFVARSQQSSWICQVLEETGGEKEVSNFIRQSQRLKNPRMKRILFSTHGLDPNAKLLAKDRHVWSLNLEKINALMDFYGKAKIVELSPLEAKHGDTLTDVQKLGVR